MKLLLTCLLLSSVAQASPAGSQSGAVRSSSVEFYISALMRGNLTTETIAISDQLNDPSIVSQFGLYQVWRPCP